MDLSDYLGPKPNVVDLQAGNRWEAIDELINHLVAQHKLPAEHRNALAACVIKRELSMSTGIGWGIGLPHASTDLVDRVVGAVGRSQKGIAYEAIDGQPVFTVFLLLVPQGQFQKHLHTLAPVVKYLHDVGFPGER